MRSKRVVFNIYPPQKGPSLWGKFFTVEKSNTWSLFLLGEAFRGEYK